MGLILSQKSNCLNATCCMCKYTLYNIIIIFLWHALITTVDVACSLHCIINMVSSSLRRLSNHVLLNCVWLNWMVCHRATSTTAQCNQEIIDLFTDLLLPQQLIRVTLGCQQSFFIEKKNLTAVSAVLMFDFWIINFIWMWII